MLVAVAGALTAVVLCASLVWGLLPASRSVEWPRPEEFRPPTLETSPVEDYRDWLARQQQRLAGAGDRIPIDRAMQAIAAMGAVAYDPPAPR